MSQCFAKLTEDLCHPYTACGQVLLVVRSSYWAYCRRGSDGATTINRAAYVTRYVPLEVLTSLRKNHSIWLAQLISYKFVCPHRLQAAGCQRGRQKQTNGIDTYPRRDSNRMATVAAAILNDRYQVLNTKNSGTERTRHNLLFDYTHTSSIFLFSALATWLIAPTDRWFNCSQKRGQVKPIC